MLSNKDLHLLSETQTILNSLEGGNYCEKVDHQKQSRLAAWCEKKTGTTEFLPTEKLFFDHWMT